MPVFEASTEFTPDIITKYCTRHLMSGKVFIIGFFSSILLGILLTLAYIIFAGYNSFAAFLLILFVALGVMVPLSWYLIPKKAVKAQSGIIGTKQIYLFYETQMKITSVSETASNEKCFSYSDFISVLQAKDAVYFYADKNQAYILSPSEFSEEQFSALKNFLHEKIAPQTFKYI